MPSEKANIPKRGTTATRVDRVVSSVYMIRDAIMQNHSIIAADDGDRHYMLAIWAIT